MGQLLLLAVLGIAISTLILFGLPGLIIHYGRRLLRTADKETR